MRRNARSHAERGSGGHSPPPGLCRALAAAIAALLPPGTQIFAADKIEYNKTIRPILAETCFACHGPDSAARKADLRIDQRDVAAKMQAIVPGDPEASELIRRIESADLNEVMPPPKTKKSLTKEQKQILRQ